MIVFILGTYTTAIGVHGNYEFGQKNLWASVKESDLHAAHFFLCKCPQNLNHS